jgi:hypothetical protein
MKCNASFVYVSLGAILAWQAEAQTNADLDLKRLPATFTTLQNKLYEDVSLLRANLDGIIYGQSNGSPVGVISYTNLSPTLLESWNIPTNRIAIAADRASQRAEQRQARQTEAARAAEATLKAKKKVAYDKGYGDGKSLALMRNSASHIPSAESLEASARNYGSDVYNSPFGSGTFIKEATYKKLDKAVQPDYVAGFKAGYEAGYRQASEGNRPAFKE